MPVKQPRPTPEVHPSSAVPANQMSQFGMQGQPNPVVAELQKLNAAIENLNANMMVLIDLHRAAKPMQEIPAPKALTPPTAAPVTVSDAPRRAPDGSTYIGGEGWGGR